MSEPIKITDEISYLPAVSLPLSCDIVIIKHRNSFGSSDDSDSEEVTWVYDVGACKEGRELINSIKGKKIIVLSHFHPDHIFNLPFIKFNEGDELIVSKNTKRYTKKGKIAEGQPDFASLQTSNTESPVVFELPSSHAKGSLCLLYKDYCFCGDGTYCNNVLRNHTYNTQLLQREIEVLEKLNCKFVGLSHDKNFIQEREALITLHKQIFSGRQPGKDRISVEEFFNWDGSVKEQ